MFFQFIDFRIFNGAAVASDDHHDLLSIPGEEESLFHRCISPADDKNILAGEKFAVAGRAVCHTVSSEFTFPLKSGQPGMSACRINDAGRLEISPIGMNCFIVAVQIKAGYFRR